MDQKPGASSPTTAPATASVAHTRQLPSGHCVRGAAALPPAPPPRQPAPAAAHLHNGGWSHERGERGLPQRWIGRSALDCGAWGALRVRGRRPRVPCARALARPGHRPFRSSPRLWPAHPLPAKLAWSPLLCSVPYAVDVSCQPPPICHTQSTEATFYCIPCSLSFAQTVLWKQLKGNSENESPLCSFFPTSKTESQTKPKSQQ